MLGGETEGSRKSLVFPKEMDIIDKLVTVPQGRTPPEQTCHGTVPRPQSDVHAGMY